MPFTAEHFDAGRSIPVPLSLAHLPNHIGIAPPLQPRMALAASGSAKVLRLPDRHRRGVGGWRANRFGVSTPQGAVWQAAPTTPAPKRQRLLPLMRRGWRPRGRRE